MRSGQTLLDRMWSQGIKILTVKQPWAWAIVHGIKTIENRSWPTSYRGPVLIHAGQSRSSLGTPLLPEAPGDPVFGAVLGLVEIIGCVPLKEAPGQRFASGPWCWLLANHQPLPRPVAWRGSLGLRQAPETLLKLLEP